MNTLDITQDAFGNITYVSLWHPVDGKWMHFAQKFNTDGVEYFTEGKLIKEIKDE